MEQAEKRHSSSGTTGKWDGCSAASGGPEMEKESKNKDKEHLPGILDISECWHPINNASLCVCLLTHSFVRMLCSDHHFFFYLTFRIWIFVTLQCPAISHSLALFRFCTENITFLVQVLHLCLHFILCFILYQTQPSKGKLQHDYSKRT